MPVDNMSVLCEKCKSALNEGSHVLPDQRIPCPSCGSTVRIYQVTIHDSLMIKEITKLKAKRFGRGKPFIEVITGDDLFRKINKWTKLSRVIDREKNLYEKIIIDPITEEGIYECKEPLSEHTGHGSDKYKKKTKG